MFKSFLLFICVTLVKGDQYIEDFSTVQDVAQWMEHSDTVQAVGKSKATLVLLRTSEVQRAVLFTLLNPQPCGAAFAGVRKLVNLDLSPYANIVLRVRGQGLYNGYKLIFKENRHNYSFCNFFKASEDFKEVTLALNDFKPYSEGKLINDSNVQLDLSKITSIGIQSYGGVYLAVKQAGAASLEIEWIKKQ